MVRLSEREILAIVFFSLFSQYFFVVVVVVVFFIIFVLLFLYFNIACCLLFDSFHRAKNIIMCVGRAIVGFSDASTVARSLVRIS